MLKKFYKRLKEPSTYATITAVLAMVGVKVDPGWIEVAAQAGMAISAALGIALGEQGPDT